MSRENSRRPAEKSYWRSLEARLGDPRAQAFLEREFPEGASELPENVSRRTLLKLVGASLSMAGLAGCRRPVEHIVPFVDAPENVLPGIPRHYATTQPTGLGGVGLVVESTEGRPIKVEGNPRHPASLGSTSATTQAEILGLYDPDRSKRVLKYEAPETGETAEGAEAPPRVVAPATIDDFVAGWATLDAELQASGGRGLAVLSPSFSSPTLARLAGQLRLRFPQASWAVHDAVSDENELDGIQSATGGSWLPVRDFSKADVVLALDCDFLLTDGDVVANARGFAERRRVTSPSDTMNRLYAVEGTHSLTGANADHRLRLASGRVAAFVASLTSALASRGLDVPAVRDSSAADIDEAFVGAVAADLLAKRGSGLIVAGRRQPPVVHAAVYALNAALGNVGTTVRYRPLTDAGRPSRRGLAELTRAMAAGQVTTLVVLGSNPVYDATADVGFSEALADVAHVIHLGSHVDETAAHANWHVPQAHFLEAWGDVRAVDGTASVIQPLIAPLYGGISDVELLGLMAYGELRSGYDLVRETWQRLLTGDFESSWNRVLHDGLLAGSALPASAPTPRPVALAELPSAARPAPTAENLELVLEVSPALWDGRHANNGWLQELPDALTKMTWDNAALISPATAAERGLQNEDVVKLAMGGAEAELPVWIVPGQADHTVSVRLGYGRTHAGRVGNGVGADAYVFRTSAAPDFDLGATLEATGATRELAQTQDHGTLVEPDMPLRPGRERPIVREADLEEYRHHPEFAQEVVEVPHESSMWEEHTFEDSPQWGMTIDLNACTGCNACVIACQSENNIPVVGREQVRNGREMHWIRVDRYFSGETEDPEVLFQSMPCQMCENAPCEQVCPVAATVHDDQGLNVMVYNRCIGTRYCSNNCPYKVRRFNFFNFTKDLPESVRLAQNPDVTVRSRGVMEKCTYCVQRLHRAQIDAKLADRPLADGDVQTACQQACPSRAIRFGDVTDSSSDVSRHKQLDRNYVLLKEIYTRPRTTYLAKLRNPNPELSEG